MKTLHLRFLEGSRAGETLSLQRPAYVGKAPESLVQSADHDYVVLSDDFISRLHAQLTVDDSGNWFIQDMGSANGTQLLWRIERVPMPLGSGGTLAFAGERGLDCEYWTEEVARPLPPGGGDLPATGEWGNISDLFDRLDEARGDETPGRGLGGGGRGREDLQSTGPIRAVSTGSTPLRDERAVNLRLQSELSSARRELDALRRAQEANGAKEREREGELARLKALLSRRDAQLREALSSTQHEGDRLKALEQALEEAKQALRERDAQLEKGLQAHRRLRQRAQQLTEELARSASAPGPAGLGATRVVQAQGILGAFGDTLDTLEAQLRSLEGSGDAQRTLGSASMRIGDLMALLQQLR